MSMSMNLATATGHSLKGVKVIRAYPPNKQLSNVFLTCKYFLRAAILS